jgi:hypothetical protein
MAYFGIILGLIATLAITTLTLIDAIKPYLPMFNQLFWLGWLLCVLLMMWRCVRGRWLL